MARRFLPVIIIFSLLFVLPNIYGQTFEPISFAQRSSGVASWSSDQVVVFGTGLMWIDYQGKILDQKRIIDGLPSSDFIDAVSDGQGGLWLMTKKSVARLTKDKKSILVIDDAKFSKIEFSEFHKTKSGEVYCLSKSQVFKVNNDNSYSTIYQSEKSKYFKNIAVGKDGTIYITDYKNVHTLKPGGELVTTEFKTNYNFNDIFYTTDDKVIVLEYRSLYEFKDGELVDFLRGHQLTSGLKIYTGSFESSNDYWLYANEGNAFRNDNGSWVNYIPPASLKTGNFGEHIHKSDNGDIWMTLRGQTILHFDGNKWDEINLDKTQSILKIHNVKLIDPSTLITTEAKTLKAYAFQNGELVPYSSLPSRKLFCIQKVGDKIYYSDENGIYSSVNNKEKRLIEGKIINFMVYNEEIIYHNNKRLWSYKNGTISEFKDNIHYLGWDGLGSLKFAICPDNKLMTFDPKRPRVISLYDGNIWKKIIQSDHKGLGSIKDIVSTGTDTYLFNKTEDIYTYNKGKLNRIFESQIAISYSSARMIPSSDNTVWFVKKEEIIVLKNGGILAKFAIPTSQKMGSIKAIVPVNEKVYNIYGANEIIQCTLP